MFDSILNTLSLDNFSVICEVTLCYLLHQRHSGFSDIQNPIYSGKCRHIQAYSALLSHIHDIEALLKHIQHPVKHSHIHNLAILRALAYLELQPYSKPSEILTRHIQKSVSVRTVRGITQSYSDIVRTL